jgi:acyl-CoA thioesterase-1
VQYVGKQLGVLRWQIGSLSLALLAGTACGWNSESSSSDATLTGSGGGGGTSGSGGAVSSGGTVGSGGTAGAGAGGSSATGSSAGMGGVASPGCENSAAIVEEHAIVESSPVVSTTRPIVASSGVLTPENLVDGDFLPNQVGNFGRLDAGAEWVAIDVGEGVSRLLLLFADAGQSAYDNINGGAPVGYSIETSADSSDGTDGAWDVVVEVTDNAVRNRAHSFDFEGMRWVRFTANVAPAGRGVTLSEIALHDISSAGGGRPQDSWLFFGDSISQAAMRRALGELSFERVVSENHAGFEPIMLNASIGGERVIDALLRLESLLELNPDIHHIGVAYGTNDAWGNDVPVAIGFDDQLVQLVEAIIEAGRTPMLARIPYATAAHATLDEFNAIIDEVRAEYGLPCGPDLYSWFEEHPEDLRTDGVHPATSGDVAINRLWAEAAGALYVDE